MQTLQEVVEALGRIPDEALLEGRAPDLAQRGYDALDDVEFEGLALRAPARVEMRKRTSVPALVATEQGAERTRQVPLAHNACFLVTRLGRGDRWASPAFPPPPGKRPGPPTKQPSPARPVDPTMRVQGVELRDLREIGALPWEPGRYAVRILAWDWQSNTVPIALDGDAAAPRPARVVAASGAPGTPDSLPSFVRGPGSPTLEGAGTALSLPSAPVQEGAPVVARGALRLEADAEWPRTAEGGAVIPAHVVLARLGIVMPIVLDLYLPVSAAGNPAPGAAVEAYFSVDLDKLAPSPLPAADYQVYLIAGEHVSAPAALRKVR
ncbi:MAG: hypothetical protein IT372_38645 [Polyangiaceae bacterium]|nr:hypothetical protein [Polyangiaceae bacterium]